MWQLSLFKSDEYSVTRQYQIHDALAEISRGIVYFMERWNCFLFGFTWCSPSSKLVNYPQEENVFSKKRCWFRINDFWQIGADFDFWICVEFGKDRKLLFYFRVVLWTYYGLFCSPPSSTHCERGFPRIYEDSSFL